MGQPSTIEKTCTVTRKGQTTLPLAIRQVLGVPDGGQVVVRVEGRRVTIEPVVEEHSDPAVGSFLDLIAADIRAHRHVGPLPDSLARELSDALGDDDPDLDEPIDGDVCL